MLEVNTDMSFRDLDCPDGADTIYITNDIPTPDVGSDYPGWGNAISSAICTADS